jgi:hypothetical protein
MAKMAKAVGFGSEAPAVQAPSAAPAAPAQVTAPVVQGQGSDLWQENDARELELPEGRRFGRRRDRRDKRDKYVGSHRPQEKRSAQRSDQKRPARAAKARPDYGFGA